MKWDNKKLTITGYAALFSEPLRQYRYFLLAVFADLAFVRGGWFGGRFEIAFSVV